MDAMAMCTGSAQEWTGKPSTERPQLPPWSSVASDALALAAHDLENPLQAILLWSQYIERLAGHDAARTRDGARAIGRCVQRMVSIVSDMLEASHTVSGEVLHCAPVTTRALFGAVGEDLANAARSRGVFLHVSEPSTPTWVNCDIARIARVLSNLVADAVHDAGAGGTVNVSVRPQDAAASFEISVEPAQWDSPANEEPECGLGRFIANALLRAHGTELSVLPRPDGGSLISFSLPAADAAKMR